MADRFYWVKDGLDLDLATVKCGLCGADTNMTSTERCNRCWELETRIKADPELAASILKDLQVEA